MSSLRLFGSPELWACWGECQLRRSNPREQFEYDDIPSAGSLGLLTLNISSTLAIGVFSLYSEAAEAVANMCCRVSV